MQDPAKEVSHVIELLSTSRSPYITRQTVEKFYTEDASFRHPFVAVESSATSRERLIGIFDWYCTIAETSSSKFHSCTFDEHNQLVYVDVSQTVSIHYSPFSPTSCRTVIRMNLQKRDGKFRIKDQEDFFHPSDALASIVPPLAPLVHILLAISAIIMGYCAILSAWLRGTIRVIVGMASNAPRGRSETPTHPNGGGRKSRHASETESSYWNGKIDESGSGRRSRKGSRTASGDSSGEANEREMKLPRQC
ncbi:hypothetical protein CONPUDRAFT_167999 [Coniophora puteana RWD-64-598 SS2]|uniref:SigF-like NTF2-like domain-containing protein n=1 Tax=Coniophora puteana (strain RWD-64-598) TaxID=741705 RepID=A0A5M3MG59_CONPW|nr:uncharacterized protein CONPUDRAFT_167999 [Coniophora puteana RWD-64-598 SS2]EIW78037.1 hypothetical protein CONPUDRAFT_167999 [Coniophora puteana RWD-64-598 SS2]